MSCSDAQLAGSHLKIFKLEVNNHCEVFWEGPVESISAGCRVVGRWVGGLLTRLGIRASDGGFQGQTSRCLGGFDDC